jgi:hypothetical protein
MEKREPDSITCCFLVQGFDFAGVCTWPQVVIPSEGLLKGFNWVTDTALLCCQPCCYKMFNIPPKLLTIQK